MNEHNAFVFVVCGSKEHLDTLQLSYKVLRNKTQLPIYIVTDQKRNEYPLDFGEIIHVATAVEFNHHEASIFLKTSLHKILPEHMRYAYLDTDILAYGENIDLVFEQFAAPITFAPDHCIMSQFGMYAINCGCLPLFEEKRKALTALQNEADPCSKTNDPVLIEKRKKLFSAFEMVKKKGRLRFGFLLKYFFSWPTFHIADEFSFDKRKKIWVDKDGTTLMHKVNMKKLGKKLGLKWNPLRNELTFPDGRSLWVNCCHHLPEKIKLAFNVDIKDNLWQHWNGGVFLFNKASHPFMDTWHQFTMQILKDPEWRTRDQGTLIATVWKMGLQNHPTLHHQWNLILDYYNSKLQVYENGEITIDGKTKIKPAFVHIYHHWGDNTWEVWNQVMRCMERTV